MTTFNEREKGFENKYKHDQETQFKITARRNKLLGLWAAEKMGVSGPAAETYAKEVVAADFEKPGDDDVVEKVVKDLGAKGLALTAHDIRVEMERLLSVARDQVLKEVKPGA
ncbi:MAG: DUF1476 domain-containing protein [Rhodospirillales bacterium]